MRKAFHKTQSVLLLIFGFVLAALLMPGTGRNRAEAADYRMLQDDYDNPGSVITSGNYYFKRDAVTDQLMISTQKNGDYQLTPMEYGIWANGRQAFYVRRNVLYKYVFSSRRETKVKTLPASGDQFYRISTVYGRRIFLTKESFDQWKFWTYTFDMKTAKFKRVMSNCNITDRYGKYVVAANEYRSDVSPYRISLYKIIPAGLTKVKKLSSYGFKEGFINGKLYYSSYPRGSVGNTTLYRCNPNGSNRKKLASFATDEAFGEVFISEVTSTSCNVFIYGKTYRYDYETKQMTEITQDD